MLNFGINPVIVIFVSQFCAHCASSESYDEISFHDHSDKHELSKRESKLPKITASCRVPTPPVGRSDKLYDWEHELIADKETGSLVPKFTQLEYECSEGYILPDGGVMSSSYCNHKSAWDPVLKSCLRTCPELQTSNVDLTCKDKRGGILDCNGPLTNGTQVTAHCTALHQVDPLSRTDSDFIQCRDDGWWDRELIKCIPDCGIPLHQPLIANGSEAQLGEFPWHVAIYKVPLGNRYICGGTLITSNMVLSAAHCFYNVSKGEPSKDPDDYEIHVGKVNSRYLLSNIGITQKFQVSKIHFAPKEYNPANSYASDIAIIVLKKNVTISQYVLPACFIRPERFGFNPGKNTMGALPGWGLDENNKVSDTLKMAQLPFMDYNECSRKVTRVTIDKFCAGAETGPKPLQGDSGGGLVFKEGLLYYVRGIVSTRGKWSDSSLTTFTDISYYLNWIETIIQQSASGNVNSSSGTGGCERRNSLLIIWSCKKVEDCRSSSKLLSTSQNYRCDASNKTTICCPEKFTIWRPPGQTTTGKETGKVRPNSLIPTPVHWARPPYIQIVEQKCNEYAEAGFQNTSADCRKFMDRDRVETLISGGTEAKPKEFPHMALIGHGKDINNIKWDDGGGTLISERFILTCARCVSKDEKSENERPTWIGLGFLNRSELRPAERNKKIFAVDGNFRHPKFNISFVYHDIGLIRLKDPVKFTPYIRPLCLHTEDNIPRETLKDIKVLGWGVSKDDTLRSIGFSETLQKVNIRVLPHELCSSRFSKGEKDILQILPTGYNKLTMICAGFPFQGRDTCFGDAGGPIQMKHATKCMYTQLGITSFGAFPCGSGEPSIYTRISYYLPWIQGIVWPDDMASNLHVARLHLLHMEN